MHEITLIVEPDGSVRHLVDKASETFGDIIGPKLQTRRASHVESWSSLSAAAQKWLREQDYKLFDAPADKFRNMFWADLLPSGGPVLGPFVFYEDAVSAEIAWLNTHNIPMPPET